MLVGMSLERVDQCARVQHIQCSSAILS